MAALLAQADASIPGKYVLERIVRVFQAPGGHYMAHVKWLDYEDSANTDEPLTRLHADVPVCVEAYLEENPQKLTKQDLAAIRRQLKAAAAGRKGRVESAGLSHFRRRVRT